MSALKIKLKGSGRVHFTTTKQVSVRGSGGKSTTKTETVHHRLSYLSLDDIQTTRMTISIKSSLKL